MKDGLLLAQNLGIRALILQGDALTVLQSFEQSLVNLYHNGIILIEAYGIASNFSFFKFQFIPTCCNLVADNLASLDRVRNNQIYIMDVVALEACL